MRRIIMAISIALLTVAFCPEIPAQDYVATPVTVSKTRVSRDGKLYYAHTVLEKQTLFSICKAYGVATDDVYTANPNLKEEGLKTNTIILIPVVSGSATSDGSEASSAAGSAGGSAAGSAGGSVAGSAGGSAAGSAGVTGSAAGAATSSDNASASNGAVSKNGSTKPDASEDGGSSDKSSKKKNKKDYFTHTVKWYEDLDVISKKYGVSVDVIMELNGLTSRKLSNKQKLKIPTNPQDYESVAKTSGSDAAAGSGGATAGGNGAGDSATGGTGGTAAGADGSAAGGSVSDRGAGSGSGEADNNRDGAGVNGRDGAAGDPDAEDYDNPDYYPPKHSKGQINALLMLPFNAEGETPGQISLDFYSGALIAAKKLGEEGINVDLSVYDTYGDVLPVTEERLASSDFVIGPLSMDALTVLMQKTPSSTYVISPMDYRTTSLAGEYSNFIQNSSSQTAQYADLAAWIGEDLEPGDSVVVISEKGSAGEEILAEALQVLEGHDYRWSSFSYAILEGRGVQKALASRMTNEGNNRILIASENEAFINDVIRNLNLLIHNKYNITLYGGSKIRSFETIDVENLHNTNLHTSLSFYIDYDDPRVMAFLMEYRALYNTEPSQAAFQGYDTMYYFASLCNKYGSRWAGRLTRSNTSMLMSDYKFERSGEGYVRTATRRVVYGVDFSVNLTDSAADLPSDAPEGGQTPQQNRWTRTSEAESDQTLVNL